MANSWLSTILLNLILLTTRICSKLAPLHAPTRPVFPVCGDQALGQQDRMFGCSSTKMIAFDGGNRMPYGLIGFDQFYASYGQSSANVCTNMPYRWSSDDEYDWEADTASDAVRMEISLCFGRHKSRESCSAKVDAMLEKWALEKRGSPNSWIGVAVFGIVVLFSCVLVCAGKMAQYS